MAVYDYAQARKLGLRAYHSDMEAKRPAYLKSLDEVAEGINGLPHISLGIELVPIDRIAGTITKARMNAFASNFMPLLEQRSEFSAKWARLYDGIVDSGMRDPIVVVEYMGYYYVREGNKRVSVMKYLGTSYCEAEVTRLQAPAEATPESRAYYAYLDWHKKTGLNVPLFSDAASYEKLLEVTGHAEDREWTEDEVMDVRAFYRRFEDAYSQEYDKDEEDRLKPEDVFAMYINVYGYSAQLLPAQIQEQLHQMRLEIQRGKTNAVDLIMEPEQRGTGSLFGALFAPTEVKAGFVYHRSIEESGWNYWHEIGRINAENELGDKFESTVRICSDPSEFETAIDELIESGHKVIFTTSPLMIDAAIRKSLENPSIYILNCSLLAGYYNVRSYYLRIYEVKFLMGMIAGAMTKNDLIGYVADYPIFGVPASINAFALGARLVNPSAKVILRWSSRKDFDENDPFHDDNVRMISNRDISAPRHSSREYGLYSIEDDGSVKSLAIPLLDWSKFYIPIIKSILDGSFAADAENISALDYYWGLASDALDIITSTQFDPYLLRLVNTIHTLIEDGQFWPFEGLMVSQDGVERCSAQSQLTPAQIITMDWLLDNIEGEIPQLKDLKEAAQPLVARQGVLEIERPPLEAFTWRKN